MEHMQEVIHDVMSIVSQIAATGITAGLFVCLFIWDKRDKKKETEAKMKAQKAAWNAEIERAGRRMMEQDRIKRIMQEDLHIKVPKKDPPLRKATGFYSDKDAQKFVKG